MSAHRKPGLAGRLAGAWIGSKLTPLLIAAAMLLGGFAVWKLPREEEPQIVVPMVDVFVADAGSVRARGGAARHRPMEKLLWEIPGVEYIYSTSSPGMSLAIVRFLVGQDEEKSIVRLNQKLSANLDLIPPGASPPLVKPRSIDDVPILALTLWSKRYGDFELRRIAAQVADSIKQTPDVSAVTLIGGQRRELRVTLDPARLAAYNLSPLADGRGAGRVEPASALRRVLQRQPRICFSKPDNFYLRRRRSQRRGRRGQRQSGFRSRRRASHRRRRGAVAICSLLRRQRILPGRDHRHLEAQGHQRGYGSGEVLQPRGAVARQRRFPPMSR